MPKWLEIDQANLHMKFSASNVDFSSLSPNPLGSTRSADEGVEEGHLPKKWLFFAIGLFNVNMIDRHRHAAYHNKHS